MRIRISKWTISVEVEHNAEFEQRKMARAVDDRLKILYTPGEIASAHYGHLKIPRIKAYRQITGAGLVEAKEWTEIAYTENGNGVIR